MGNSDGREGREEEKRKVECSLEGSLVEEVQVACFGSVHSKSSEGVTMNGRSIFCRSE